MAKIKMAKIHYEIKPSFTTRKLKEIEQENKQLKERIDKAIEYIYRNWITYDEATKFTTFNEEMEVCIKEIKELLEILGDKE